LLSWSTDSLYGADGVVAKLLDELSASKEVAGKTSGKGSTASAFNGSTFANAEVNIAVTINGLAINFVK